MTLLSGVSPARAFGRAVRAIRSPAALLLVAVLFPAGGGLASAQVLNAGKVYPKFAVGVTGIHVTIENLEVVVRELTPGSWAAGTALVTGDILTSVEGNSLAASDPRVVLGEALTAAEGSDGMLVFGVQGKADVTVTIPVIDSYVPEWPAGGCPKSAAIITDLAAFVASKQQLDGGYNFTGNTIRDGLDGCLTGLFLLSTGDPAYLPNVELHAQNLAAAAAGNPGTNNWHLGYKGILLAEYFLKTGDATVLAGLQSLCDRAVLQQWAGGWGHSGGGTPGYVQSGLMNSAGVPCLTTLILGRECGVTVDDTAYKLALELMYRVAGHGCVPYGDHRPEMGSNTNGRNAMLACAFSLLDDPATTDQPHYKSAAEHMAMLVVDSYYKPEAGHTGGGFNVMWRGMGSVHVPAAKDAHRQLQMNKLAWYYDLCRQPGGGFAILPTPPDNARYSNPGLNWGCGSIGLTYTAPLATLRITGGPKTVHSVADTPPPFTWGTPADLEFLGIEPAAGFGVEDDEPEEVYDWLAGANKGSVTEAYCEKYLRHYSPMVRFWAARRLKEINTAAARTALANAVSHPDPRVRRAVYDALSGYESWSRPFSANIASSDVSSTFMTAITGTLNDANAAWWEIDGALLALGNALSGDIRANLPRIDEFALHEEWFLREAAFWSVVGLGNDITGPEFKRLTDAYARSVGVFERSSFDPGIRTVLQGSHDAFHCGQRAASVRTLGGSFMNVAIRPGYEQFKGDHEAVHRTMMVLDDFDGEVYRFMVDDIVRYLQTWEPGNQHSDWVITGSPWQVGFLAVLQNDLGAYGKPLVDAFKTILANYEGFSGGTPEQKQAIQDAVDQWEAVYDPLVYAPPSPTATLTAYYDFEGDFDDAPGAGSFPDDLVNNGASFSSDVPGVGGSQSASFDGDAALSSNAFTTDLGPDRESYTIMFWVKAADLAQENGDTRLMTTRVRPAGGGAAQPAWQVGGFGNSGSNGDLMKVRFSEGACGPENWDSPGATGAVAKLGESAGWHHVAYVVANSAHPDFSGDAYSRTFVDGVALGLEAETPWTDHPLGNTEGMLIIGGDATDGGDRGFTGLVDDVALFSGAVSHVDIAAIAAGTRSPADPLLGPPAPNALAPDLGPPSVSNLFPDSATLHSDLRQSSANVLVVWAHADQGESDLSTWTSAPGGGFADLGNFAPGVPLSYELTGLDPGTHYAYRFLAANPEGVGWSAAAGLTTLGVDAGDTLKIYLLTGQSNMEGQAYTHDNVHTDGWNIPTMEFLLGGTAAATNYLANMPFGFKNSLDASWMTPQPGAYCVHHDSGDGTTREVMPTTDPLDNFNGVGPLSPGFGVNTNFGSMFGAELSMGIRLSDALASPVFLFKSNKGGTTLAEDWRPPSAVAARGGTVGSHYTNTVTQFQAFLDTLDADLADDGMLNAYDNATSYEICGLVWIQGWNEVTGNGGALIPEYDQNLVDLVQDLRGSDPRVPADLPMIIPESADQDAALNAERQAAVATLNAGIAGSAVFIENNDMKNVDWGNNELGAPFSQDWGYHFHARAENFLEIGWRIGGEVLARGYVGTLTGGNRAPGADDATFDVDENSAEGTLVGQVVANDPDPGQVLGYAITDGDPGGLFAIGSTTGRITVAGSIDYETDSRHVLTVTVTDSGVPVRADTATITVDVNDLFEVVTAPVLATGASSDVTGSSASLDFTISDTGGENPVVTVHYGLSNAGTDPGGWDGSAVLGVTGSGGHTAAISGLLPGTAYFYTFSASNSGGTGWGTVGSFTTELTASAGVRLTAYYDFEGAGAERFDDPAGDFADDLAGRYNPSFSADTPGVVPGSQSASFDGNSALFTDAYSADLGPDPDAFTIMFWIKGRDIDQENNNTRLMTSRVQPNGSNSSYSRWQIEGFGNNGANGDRMDVRMAGTGLPTNWFSPDATNALARDDQGETTAEWHHVAFVLANSGHPTNGGAYGATFVDGVRVGGYYDPDSGYDGVDISNLDGQLILGGSAENAGSRAFTGLLDDVALFAGVVDDADIASIAAGAVSPAAFLSSPPVVADATFAVDENSVAGTVVGQVVASDPDAGQTLGYEISSGDPGGLFAIDGGGEITVAGVIDHEAASQHILTVTVSDDGEPPLSASAQVTINVTNLVETNGEAIALALTGPGGPFEGQSDPLVVGFAANPDGDRWGNAIEILFGYDPSGAEFGSPMTVSFVEVGEESFAEVEIEVDAAMDDLLTWHLDFSSNLTAWNESSNPRVVVGEAGGVRTITIRDDQPLGSPGGRFFRIRIEETE